MYFTNYNPQFWPGLLKWRTDASSGSGVLLGVKPKPGSGVLPGSTHPYAGHLCDTGTFWLQWHGSHVYGVMSAVCENFIARSEAHKIDEADVDPDSLSAKQLKEGNTKQQAKNKEKYETDGAGRGVYTSQAFHKASQYAVPLLVGDGKYMAKFVLLCAIPGDGCDDGVAVNFKASRSESLWQSDSLKLGNYVRIPRDIVTESAAESYPKEEKEKIMKNLHRFSGQKSARHLFLEDDCKSIIHLMQDCKFKPYDHLEAKRSRHKMVQIAKEGSQGEEPWTVMNLDGEECVSSAVHVVGFLVGITGYAGRELCPSRDSHVVEAFDMRWMPSMLKKAPGDEPVQPKSKILADCSP